MAQGRLEGMFMKHAEALRITWLQLTKLKNQGVINTVLFKEIKQTLVFQHNGCLDMVYSRAEYEARAHLLERSRKLINGQPWPWERSMFQRVRRLYHWKKLQMLKISRHQLESYVRVLRYSGSVTLPDDIEVNSIDITITNESYDVRISDWFDNSEVLREIVDNTGSVVARTSISDLSTIADLVFYLKINTNTESIFEIIEAISYLA